MTSRSEREPVLKLAHTCLVFILLMMIISHSACYPSTTGFTNANGTSSTLPCSEVDCRNSNQEPETQCHNDDGWNLKGSEWGCCGNYDGCCTYASFICYIHDAMCRCCHSKLCGPECKSEPDCTSALTDNIDKSTKESEQDDKKTKDSVASDEVEKKTDDSECESKPDCTSALNDNIDDNTEISEKENIQTKNTVASDYTGTSDKTLNENTEGSDIPYTSRYVESDEVKHETKTIDEQDSVDNVTESTYNDKVKQSNNKCKDSSVAVQTTTAVKDETSFNKTNMSKATNFKSDIVHYQRDQGFYSKDDRKFENSDVSEDVGSGDAEEKVTL